MSRTVYDIARRAIKSFPDNNTGLLWISHGEYSIENLDEPIEIREVGKPGVHPLIKPSSSKKAVPVLDAEEKGKLCLEWLNHISKSKTILLTGPVCNIGRQKCEKEPWVDLTLRVLPCHKNRQHPHSRATLIISRKHFILKYKNNDFFIRKLPKTNPVKIFATTTQTNNTTQYVPDDHFTSLPEETFISICCYHDVAIQLKLSKFKKKNKYGAFLQINRINNYENLEYIFVPEGFYIYQEKERDFRFTSDHKKSFAMFSFKGNTTWITLLNETVSVTLSGKKLDPHQAYSLKLPARLCFDSCTCILRRLRDTDTCFYRD